MRRHGSAKSDPCPLVGTPGFEPGTSCAPCKHATRLRHVPIDRVHGIPPAAAGQTHAALPSSPPLHKRPQTKPVVVLPGEILGDLPRHPRPAERAVERVLRTPPLPGEHEQEGRHVQRHTADGTANADPIHHAPQSSSPSFPLKLIPNPLPLIRSRRLIMYPLAIDSASSCGIPASTSFL